MSLAQYGYRLLSELVALIGACSPPRSGFRVLMYHSVGGVALGDDHGYYGIARERFVRHMETLRDFSGVDVVPFSAQHVGEGGAKVAITFDDGYRDNLLVAAPILAGLGMPFTVFVAAALVRERRSGFLAPEELRELADMPGVSIGAHGNTHVPLAGCNDARLREELCSSKACLEDMTGRAITMMSYPHGSVDKRVRDAVAAAGYELAASSHEGINRNGRDPFLLSRTTVFAQDGERFFRRKLAGCWDWYGCLQCDPAGIAGGG